MRRTLSQLPGRIRRRVSRGVRGGVAHMRPAFAALPLQKCAGTSAPEACLTGECRRERAPGAALLVALRGSVHWPACVSLPQGPACHPPACHPPPAHGWAGGSVHPVAFTWARPWVLPSLDSAFMMQPGCMMPIVSCSACAGAASIVCRQLCGQLCGQVWRMGMA